MLGQFSLIAILVSNFIINTNGGNPYQELEKLLQDIPEHIHDKRGIKRLSPYQSRYKQLKDDVSMPLDRSQQPTEDVSMPLDWSQQPREDVSMPVHRGQQPNEDVSMPVGIETLHLFRKPHQRQRGMKRLPTYQARYEQPREDVSMPVDRGQQRKEDVSMPVDRVQQPKEDVSMPVDIEILNLFGKPHQRQKGIEQLSTYKSRYEQPKEDVSMPMTIETIDLFGKPHQRQRRGVNLDKFIRTETERICKETGRCGCSGSRCGNRPEDEAANEVVELVNEINKQLSTYDRNRNKLVGKKDNIFSKHKDGDENLLEDKKIKLNEDVDILVLKPEEIDDLLKSENFIDLTKNSIILDTDKDKFTSGPKNPDHLRDLIAEIMIKTKSNKKSVSDKNTNKVSLDDLSKYYETLRNQITNLFAFYIKNNKNEIPIEEHLTDYQLQLLEDLKRNYQRGNLRENKIKSEIIKVIFEKDSETKILPHSKDNQNVYIPKRIYDDIFKSEKNNLRSINKQILPLTFQQKKNRLITKNKARIIPKLIWRRSHKQDYQDLGIPFNLEVHGLGQINPNQ